ncbi:MAG: hypothetical protein JNJ54_22680 [Myxococcaceae bacterium]|nr:hypothetical protein [Myxococcaceae bacterium]
MRAVFFASIAVSAASCALNLEQVRTELTPRAVSDLSCKASKLEFTEVQQLLAPSRVKVTGCGRFAEYMLEQSRWRPVKSSGPPPDRLQPQ